MRSKKKKGVGGWGLGGGKSSQLTLSFGPDKRARATTDELGLDTDSEPAPNPQPPIANQAGFTLLELIITLAIIAILTAGTVPVARNLIKREREMELRRNLRELRKAIDSYKISCDLGNVGPLDRKQNDECYPPSLEILVEGIHPPNKGDTTIRFLRRIPKDPFTGNTDWGTRSVQDDPGGSGGGNENVYDVFSKAPGTALDGKTQYKDW